MSKIIKSNANTADMVGLKMVIFGPPGHGKTYFAAQAKNVLVGAAEKGGMLCVREQAIDLWPINSFDDVQELYMFLRKGGHDYKTIVLDTITEIQKKAMDKVLAKAGRQDPVVKDWGETIRMISNMCRLFRDLPMNVIFIAHETTDKDEETGERFLRMSVNGQKLPEEIAGFVDCVGYFIATEKMTEDKKSTYVSRAIRFGATKTIMCKDRSGKLDTWEKPDFEAIYTKIFGNLAVPEMSAAQAVPVTTPKPLPPATVPDALKKANDAPKAITSTVAKETPETAPEPAKQAKADEQIDVVAARNEVVGLLKQIYNNDTKAIKDYLQSLGYRKTADIPEMQLVTLLIDLRSRVAPKTTPANPPAENKGELL